MMGNDGFMVIDANSWANATGEQRDWMIFNTLRSINARLENLEKKDKFHKFCVGLGVVVGGIAAWVLKYARLLGGER